MGEDGFQVGALGEADRVVDGVAGAADLVQRAAGVDAPRVEHRVEEWSAVTRLEHDACTSMPPGRSSATPSRVSAA